MPTLLLSLLLALALPAGLDLDDAVVMDGGVTYVGLVTTEEVDVGGTLKLDLYFTASGPLPADVLNFLHVESGETACRLVEDAAPGQPVDGVIKRHVELPLGASGPCAEPQRLDIYTGLYHRGTGGRVRVVKPASRSDRIYAGHVDVVADGADQDLVAMQASAMSSEETMAMVRPWTGWLLALGGAALLALVLFVLTRVLGQRLPPLPDWAPAEPRGARRLKWAMVLIVGIPLAASILAGLDFIKDDAYITFRYAHNAVHGHGLVFNPGERVEGATTFLWTLLMMPFEALGLDMFQVCEVLGTAFIAGLLVYMTRIGQMVDGRSPWLVCLWAPLWIATSSSVAKWSTSGMEQPLAMLLPVASAYFLWRSWGLADKPRKYRFDGLTSGVLMGLGALTRPEIHLVALFFGFALLVRTIATWVRERRFDRTILWWSLGALVIVTPAHLFRYLYYGSLVPNTFYVKTSDSSLVMIEGLKMLHDMFAFNDTGLLLVLVPFAFVRRERLTEKLLMLATALAFMFYLVKVGRDEMEWHRLYLPALPFLAMLAASGLVNLARLVTAVLRGLPQFITRATARFARLGLAERAPLVVAWLVVVIAAASSFGFTYREMGGFNGRGDLSGNFHPDMGKFLVRHERPGGLVAFQDMGSTPYYAPDIAFLDFIGLVDATVAHARYRYGLHAFLATEAQRNKPAFDREMREYFYERNPEWAILTTYIAGGATKAVSERFAKNPVPESLGGAFRQNGYQFGIVDDKFLARYVHVRTWPRSAGYYLSLFRRRDLWDKIPGEVVLDAVPPGIGGVKAKLGRGVELLGTQVEPTATERHEFFVTLWFRVAGPLEPDIFVFHHVENDTFRLPYDAIPGDWMYPANRWRAGDIIEHRVLVQIPPGMNAGEYKVFVGLYRRSTGERLPVLEGPNDGQNRIPIGEVEITTLMPPFDQSIEPTDIEKQRKYPDRIIDNGRPPVAD